MEDTVTSKAGEPLPISPDDLLRQFNEIFHDTAHARIADNRLSITIGNRTMLVQLPTVIGVASTGESNMS